MGANWPVSHWQASRVGRSEADVDTDVGEVRTQVLASPAADFSVATRFLLTMAALPTAGPFAASPARA